jgi:hypothetical protein
LLLPTFHLVVAALYMFSSGQLKLTAFRLANKKVVPMSLLPVMTDHSCYTLTVANKTHHTITTTGLVCMHISLAASAAQ